MMTWAIASASAPSVPGRSCRCRSECVAIGETRGSTVMMVETALARVEEPFRQGVLVWKGLALHTSRQRALAMSGAPGAPKVRFCAIAIARKQVLDSVR